LWSFLAAPEPVPERLLGHAPEAIVDPIGWDLAHTTDGALDGVIMAARNPSSAVIAYVGVVPELRGRGLAARLVRRGPSGSGWFAVGKEHAVDKIRRCWPVMLLAMAVGMSMSSADGGSDVRDNAGAAASSPGRPAADRPWAPRARAGRDRPLGVGAPARGRGIVMVTARC